LKPFENSKIRSIYSSFDVFQDSHDAISTILSKVGFHYEKLVY